MKIQKNLTTNIIWKYKEIYHPRIFVFGGIFTKITISVQSSEINVFHSHAFVTVKSHCKILEFSNLVLSSSIPSCFE